MAEKLKPCPLCGGPVKLKKVKYKGGAVSRHVVCRQCGSWFPHSGSKEETISLWNKRNYHERRLPGLRACPLCGGTAGYWELPEGTWYVQCEDGCEFTTPDVATPEQAAKIWNSSPTHCVDLMDVID